jgi:hypothetical protein
MEGHLVGSEENNIKGEATHRWLPGGFFLEQRITLGFMGMRRGREREWAPTTSAATV